jgi:hypothetical protein
MKDIANGRRSCGLNLGRFLRRQCKAIAAQKAASVLDRLEEIRRGLMERAEDYLVILDFALTDSAGMPSPTMPATLKIFSGVNRERLLRSARVERS